MSVFLSLSESVTLSIVFVAVSVSVSVSYPSVPSCVRVCLSGVRARVPALCPDSESPKVEFNRCANHSVSPGPVNVYNLGSFVSHNVGTVYSVNNCI